MAVERKRSRFTVIPMREHRISIRRRGITEYLIRRAIRDD